MATAALRRVSVVQALVTLRVRRAASINIHTCAWRGFGSNPHFTTAPSLSDRAKKYEARLAASRAAVAPQKEAPPATNSTLTRYVIEVGSAGSAEPAPELKLVLSVGDLTTFSGGAIVNAANQKMLGGGGVDGAIHRAAGPGLLAECKKVVEVSPGVRCPTGEARLTRTSTPGGFGSLQTECVIHTVGPRGKDADRDAKLRAAYQNSIELACKEPSLDTIAFPSISTGIFGFPLEAAAWIAMSTSIEALRSQEANDSMTTTNLHTIEFFFVDKATLDVYRAAAQRALRQDPLASSLAEFVLPPAVFPVAIDPVYGDPTPALCRVVPASSGRRFGPFRELTLECNSTARGAIDQVCDEGGFTQDWSSGSTEGFSVMTKIPVIVLVKLMQGLPEAEEHVAKALVGAYSICMSPGMRTCMNVIVGRRRNPSGNGYVLDKFSLYYPNNEAVPDEWMKSKQWDLLQGFSFRTAALTGSLNRAGLNDLRLGRIPTAAGVPSFDCDEYGLVIDSASAYEDCAYVKTRLSESDSDRVERIDSMVEAMVAAYSESGILSLSYDPVERKAGKTALESEWLLLKRQCTWLCASED